MRNILITIFSNSQKVYTEMLKVNSCIDILYLRKFINLTINNLKEHKYLVTIC